MIEAAMPQSQASDRIGGNRLLNRELSSLDFYARILELASDPSVPLLERVRFCSIFSSHLDEFFMVRVAGLLGQEDAGVGTRSPDGRTASEALAEIRERVLDLMSRQSKLWKRELRPALAAEGIVVAHVEDCEPKELEELTDRFERQIFPVLTPLAVGPGQPFPYISGLSLSLGLFVRDPDGGEERFARVKVPELLPRFLPVGKRGVHLPLESVIRHFLPLLFPKMEIVEHATFRVARNADFEVSDEADDLLEAVELELLRRRFGEVVRLEVAGSASSRMLSRLQHGLGIGERETFTVQGLLDLVDVGQFSNLPRPDLKYEPWVGITHPRFVSENGTIFDEVRRGDILVHHPYTSFATSFQAFVQRAAHDPNVVGLKATVYRTSDDSPLVPALIEASEEGKQTVCLVELKARFDEHRNIEWSRALERAGVHVVYGFPNLKIHGKTTLVVRREGADLKRYVHVGTGNYHARTARGYEDFGLFTADEEIAADVADLFNYLTGFGRPRDFRKILVAPFGLRERLIEHIRAVAKHGKDGRVRIKVNSLTDPRVIEALYAASQEGARIEIVARSICSLRPGVDGMSETIRVRSVLGRYLEHSRLFIFESPDSATFLIGSADLMPRNLDNRVEVVAPVEDARAQQEISRVFDVLLADNAEAWDLDGDGRWRRARPGKGERSRSTQTVLMRNALARARRRLANRSSA
jgi:polyphosphate kinase